MIRFNTIRFKISILYVLILGAILLAYSIFLYLTLRHTLYADLQKELRVKAHEIADLIDTYYGFIGNRPSDFSNAAKTVILHPKGKAVSPSSTELELKLFNIFDKYDLREDFIVLLDKDGTVLTKSETVNKDIEILFNAAAKNLIRKNKNFRTIHYKDWNLRLYSFKHAFKDGNERIVQVGTRLREILFLLKRRLYYFTFTIIFIMLFAGFIGRMFALRILRPIKALASTATRITHEDLSSKVEVENIDEEMVTLVNAFNNMISRLERSFQYIKEFSSYVAHELKTPLAVIRGESEVALLKESTPDEYKELIHKNLKEVRHMVRVIDDLLLLTSLDYDQSVFHFELKDLIPFLTDLEEQVSILARSKNINVKSKFPSGPIQVLMDEVHLRRLFLNIFNNAVKFSPPGSVITVIVEMHENSVSVKIKDLGPGIPEMELKKIFEKFYHRLRPGQTEKSGHGLGLSIARSIADAHRGSISVESSLNKGTTFIINLPLSS